MNIYLPKQYDLQQLKDKAQNQIPSFSKSAFYRIVYLIQDSNFRAHYMNYKPVIHSLKFKNVTPQYRAYTMFLEEQGLITRNDYFKVGEQSYLYQFNFKYHESLVYSHIIEDKIYHLSVNENIYNDKPEIILNENIIDKFKLYLYYLKFDSLGANQLKENLYQNRLRSPDIDYTFWNWVKDEDKQWAFINQAKYLNPVEQYNFEQVVIDKLTQKNYYCHMDASGWRVHTPLTILPREYKKFVTFRGQELFSIDLRCSQIFLTLVLLNKCFWSADSNTVNISMLKMAHLFEKPNILNKIFKSINNLGEDYNIYKQHCCNGSIYEYMQARYNEDLDLDLKRDDVKVQFYLTLFTANNFLGSKQAEPKRLFKSLFPTVYEVFKAIKTQRKNEPLFLNANDTTPLKKSSTLLPLILQRLESYIFIQNIAASIITNNPNIPIFTVHDSISTTEEFVPLVKKIIQSELERITGFSPTLKITSWMKE